MAESMQWLATIGEVCIGYLAGRALAERDRTALLAALVAGCAMVALVMVRP